MGRATARPQPQLRVWKRKSDKTRSGSSRWTIRNSSEIEIQQARTEERYPTCHGGSTWPPATEFDLAEDKRMSSLRSWSFCPFWYHCVVCVVGWSEIFGRVFTLQTGPAMVWFAEGEWKGVWLNMTEAVERLITRQFIMSMQWTIGAKWGHCQDSKRLAYIMRIDRACNVILGPRCDFERVRGNWVFWMKKLIKTAFILKLAFCLVQILLLHILWN